MTYEEGKKKIEKTIREEIERKYLTPCRTALLISTVLLVSCVFVAIWYDTSIAIKLGGTLLLVSVILNWFIQVTEKGIGIEIEKRSELLLEEHGHIKPKPKVSKFQQRLDDAMKNN